jgi:(p)ppGpp synthase/HD superfamily hydrolase
MVENAVKKHKKVFKWNEDFHHTLAAASMHDLIEDAQWSFNDVKNISDFLTAKIVLDVTDIHEENRLLRHLMTMGKTVKDYRSIILKLCDINANASYSKAHMSSMYPKYVEEYQYRKPIFKKSLNWYKDKLNMDAVELLWLELDLIHNAQ